MISIITNILLFILVIGFLTFIHEFGHFIVAKLIGAKVYEFALGFGPKIISKEYRNTVYSIRAIPLGGFVKILGDGDPGEYEKKENVKKDKGNLNGKPKTLQMLVMLAGVFMNLLFAIFSYYTILGISNWKTSPIYVDLEGVKTVGAQVDSVIGYQLVPDGNAQKAGLPEYGIVKKIDDIEILTRDSLLASLKEKKYVNVYACDDTGEECDMFEVEVGEEDRIGMYVSVGKVFSYEQNKIFSGFAYLVNNLKIIGRVLGSMIGIAKETGDYSDLSNTVSGPIGIFLLIDNLKDQGIVVFLSLIADLSLSLAIMNLLPIPALDGGRVLILLIEGIFRKDLDEKVEALIINGSMIFLILLIVAIMVKDIVNFQDMKNMFG